MSPPRDLLCASVGVVEIGSEGEEERGGDATEEITPAEEGSADGLMERGVGEIGELAPGGESAPGLEPAREGDGVEGRLRRAIVEGETRAQETMRMGPAGLVRGNVWGEEEGPPPGWVRGGTSGAGVLDGEEEWDDGVGLNSGMSMPRVRNLPSPATTGDKPFVPPPMRIRAHREFWRDTLHATPAEMQLIDEGHTPKWKDGVPPPRKHSVPPLAHPDNAKQHAAALECALKGIILSELPENIEFVAPTFIIPEGGGKERWIWNGSYLTPFCVPEKFRMEGPEFVRGWVPVGDTYGAHFDNEKAFYHGAVAVGARKWFGLCTRDEFGVLHYWVFAGWPMGYCKSSILYHHLMRPITRYLRSRGVLISLYCDDGFILGLCFAACERNAALTRWVLDMAGVTWSPTKTDWVPKRVVAHIGFVWDFEHGLFRLTPSRLEKINHSLDSMSVVGQTVTHYELASAVGRCISAMLLVGTVVRVLLRDLYAVVTPPAECSWDSVLRVTEEMVGTVRLLKRLFKECVMAPLVQSLAPPLTHILTDASEDGGGLFLFDVEGVPANLMAVTPFVEGISAVDSSTLREVSMGVPALEVYAERLDHKLFGYGLDSQPAVRAFQVGSPVREIQRLVIAFYIFCWDNLHGATPRPFWLPREEIAAVDAASKDVVDHNDYQVTAAAWRRHTSSILRRRGQWWGTIVDVFGGPADEVRECMPVFWSRYYCRAAGAWDAFLQSWRPVPGRALWLFPPIPLLSRAINKMRSEGATGFLVFPMWQNRPFMPLLFDAVGHSCREIVAWRRLQDGEIVLGAQGRPDFLVSPQRGRRRSPFVVVFWRPVVVSAPVAPRPALCTALYFTGRCVLCRPAIM